MTKNVIIFTLILSINTISPVSADEECTNLSQEDIQSSIDKATEGKTPSEVSVEVIINQINQDFNTSCTQEQFFNLQKNALENGKCLAEFEFNEFYKIADNFVNNLSLFRNQAETAVAITQQFMVDVEALNLGPIAEIANAGSQNMDQVNALDERIAVLEQRNEELIKELGYSTSSENLSDSSNTANLNEINSLLEQIDQLYLLQGSAYEIESLQQQVQSLNDYATDLQGVIDSASEDSDTSAVEEQLTTTREEISSLEAVIAERESTTNGLTSTDINNRISELEAKIAQLQSESNSKGSNADTSTSPSDNPLEQEFQRNIEELERLQQEVETLLTNVSQSSEEAVNTSINEANLMEQEAMDLYFGVYIELKMAADYLAMLEIHDRAFFNGMLRVASNCDAEYYKSNGLELQYGKLIKKLSDVSSILEATANNLKEVSVFEATTFNALKKKYASMGIDFNVQFFECPVDEPNCEPPPPPEG
tara:strand:+ start:1085 stop:2527 length:1443 start_codon:yes stop_codon:yes gene_type:complete